jgi:hypothetical protein
MLVALMLLAAFGASDVARAAEPGGWTLPLVGVGETATENVASVVANREQRKLYVGVLSLDAGRSGLWVFDLGEDGQPTGKARKYADHPDELPAGHHSTPVCLLHDARNRKLFLGVQGSHPTHARSLVMWSLDERGEPVGKPEAFDHGNPNKSCDAMTIHPTNGRLIAVGWGGEGVFVLDRDDAGRPIGKPTFHRTGGYGGSAVALRADGTKLYRGTYPSVIEVCDLDARGDVVGAARLKEIPNGPKEYARFVATDRAIYFRGPDKRLAWFTLDKTGEIVGEMQSADIANLQAVAAAEKSDRLLIAVAARFTDAITGKEIVHGVEVREVALNADGTPGEVVRKTPPFVRAEAVSLSGGNGAALAAKSLGRGFLGNRIAGLKARVTLLSLEPDGAPLPALTAIKFGEQQRYLRFAVSAKFGRVYAAADDSIVVADAASAFAPRNHAPFAERKATLSGAVAVDDRRGMLFAALANGSIVARKLNERGEPVGDGAELKTSLSAIGALAVHPETGLVYAFGLPGGLKVETAGVVAIPAGGHVSDAVLDAERGRLYVVGAYRGRENTSVWKLDKRGQLVASEPTWLADGIPVEKPEIRGMLSAVRLDASRRKLYVAGAQENPTTQLGYLIVRDLDERGDVVGEPRLLPSANPRVSCWAIELSSDGKWLFESGWGENSMFVRSLDERGEPSRESTKWLVGNHGKQQLSLLKRDGKDLLLAGTFPSELEVIPLRTPGEAEAGAQVEVAVETLHRKLGMMSAGQTSEWIDLDAALKDGIGAAVVRCTLGGTNVKRATLRWEVARQVGDKLEPVRSAELSLVGNVGALVVPKYGLDDAGPLASRVTTSAEEFARYREFAQKYAVSPTERPERLLVANGLIGLDSSDEALEAGMATLELLGHNAAQIWNWPGVAPETIRAAAERHGIRRFREAIYNPPSYFHYNVDLVAPESLDKWAAGFRDAAAKMGAKPSELELMHIGDEPGWYFPSETNDVRNDPRRLAVFREYLKSKGLTPADVGATKWDEVFPGSLSTAKTLPQRRLFFWTTRFYAESLSLSFAAATEALQRQVNPRLLTTMNLNNWPGRFYIPSPGVKLANNSDAGPDAGMGMPDWFDLGRKRAVTCLWTEDWFGDSDAQLWSLYGDLLRCATREGSRTDFQSVPNNAKSAGKKAADWKSAVRIEYGGYPVGQSTGAMPDGATLKIAALIGHGATVIDPYTFGPNLAFGDGWSEKEVTYRNLGSALRLIGKAERLTLRAEPSAFGRPRDGSVAIVFPQASQVWDANSNSNCYQQELYGLHAALIHENFPVDFVDDFSLEAGDLKRRKYAAIYVTAPNLSVKAQQALRAWTTAGGTLVLLPGACAADEYNEPTTELRALIGATQDTVPRVAPPHYSQAFRVDRAPVTWKVGLEDQPGGFAISQTVPLTPTTAKPLATFANNDVAATEIKLGNGRAIAFGFWPGVSYWLSPDRTDPTRLPTDWSDAARQIATFPARQANAAQHVVVGKPGVEACLLESETGLTITLLNWTGRPIPKLAVTIPNAGQFRSLQGAEAGMLTPSRNQQSLSIELPLNSAEIVVLGR